jgi:hypothetical protein
MGMLTRPSPPLSYFPAMSSLSSHTSRSSPVGFIERPRPTVPRLSKVNISAIPTRGEPESHRGIGCMMQRNAPLEEQC